MIELILYESGFIAKQETIHFDSEKERNNFLKTLYYVNIGNDITCYFENDMLEVRQGSKLIAFKCL